MASWEQLRNVIVSVLESVSSVQEVHEFPTEEFNGNPAAVIETIRSESDFQTITDNRRTYFFSIYVYQEVKTKTPKQARRIIQGVSGDIMDAFDNDQLLSGASMPSNEVLVISLPALSNIFTSEDAKYIIGEIELKVVTQFSTS